MAHQNQSASAVERKHTTKHVHVGGFDIDISSRRSGSVAATHDIMVTMATMAVIGTVRWSMQKQERPRMRSRRVKDKWRRTGTFLVATSTAANRTTTMGMRVPSTLQNDRLSRRGTAHG